MHPHTHTPLCTVVTLRPSFVSSFFNINRWPESGSHTSTAGVPPAPASSVLTLLNPASGAGDVADGAGVAGAVETGEGTGEGDWRDSGMTTEVSLASVGAVEGGSHGEHGAEVAVAIRARSTSRDTGFCSMPVSPASMPACFRLSPSPSEFRCAPVIPRITVALARPNSTSRLRIARQA